MSGSDGNGWPTSLLGDVIVAKYGKSLPKVKRSGGDVPVYGSNGVVGGHDVAITRGPTIVIGRKGSSGAVNYSPTACWPIDTTYYVDEPGPFTLQFLELLLQTLGLEEMDQSTAIPGLNRDEMYEIEVPVPTQTVQREIVRLVSRHRQLAASASGHLAAARRSTERFRDAVLAAGCSGRLTSEYRHAAEQSVDDDLKRHAEMSDATVNKRRIKPATGLAVPDQSERFPSSWAHLHIRELVERKAFVDVQDGNHGALYPRKTDFGETGVPFISAESVWGRLEIETAPKLNRDVAARLRIGFARPRDVILTHNATVGRVAMMPEDAPPVVLSTSTTYYRVDERVLLPEYLLLFMRSPYFQEQLSAVMSQTTRNQVPVTKQVELMIAVPPPDEQRAIVERASRLLQLAEDADSRIDAAARDVGFGSQAVLAKAFRLDLLADAEIDDD